MGASQGLSYILSDLTVINSLSSLLLDDASESSSEGLGQHSFSTLMFILVSQDCVHLPDLVWGCVLTRHSVRDLLAIIVAAYKL